MDIVDALRDWTLIPANRSVVDFCREAATAIENLHAAYSHSQQQFMDASEEITRLRAENERLQRIAFLIGSIYAHGDFKAETINEHELEQQLRLNGTFWTTPQEVWAHISAQDAALSPSGGADAAI